MQRGQRLHEGAAAATRAAAELLVLAFRGGPQNPNPAPEPRNGPKTAPNWAQPHPSPKSEEVTVTDEDPRSKAPPRPRPNYGPRLTHGPRPSPNEKNESFGQAPKMVEITKSAKCSEEGGVDLQERGECAGERRCTPDR
jgi:hypothetical protein